MFDLSTSASNPSDRFFARLKNRASRALTRFARSLFEMLKRSKARHFVRNIAFTCLPFKTCVRGTIWFRHFYEHPALDRHFSFFCGPFLTQHLDWVMNGPFTKRYPIETTYYLLLCGFRAEALILFRRMEQPNKDPEFDSAFEGVAMTGQGYSMDLLTQIHRLDWAYVVNKSLELRTFVRLMLEHRNFQQEERVFERHVALKSLTHDAPVEQYIPYFFGSQDLIDCLRRDLNLPDATGLLKSPDAAAQDDEAPLDQQPRQADSLDVCLFYAYRHLLLRTYHNGEGHLVPLVYNRCMETQRRLRRSLPAPSAELKRVLDRIGVELPDVRLLSPDWSALIGHNGHLNVHLMMREMGWWKGSPVLLAYKNRIANKTFLSLFDEICPTLTLGENVAPAAWHELASLTPFLGDSHQAFEFEDGRAMYWNDAGAMALQKWEREKRGFPLREIYDARLRSNDRAETLFQSLRQKWGMGPDDWHVCLHMRDAEARGETLGKGESIRSTVMGNYLETIRHITAMGGWVIRMGGRKAPPLPAMPRVIDYARSEDQIPEMDIHLVRRARMFIGTTSGFAYVASSFGIPTAMVNALSSVGLLWSEDTRFALKPVRTRDGRMLSLRDVTSERWRWAFPTYETVTSAGLVVSESSPDEILETTKEVLDLSGRGKPLIEPVDDSWETCVNIQGFFGSSRPARYFLEKYSASLLAED